MKLKSQYRPRQLGALLLAAVMGAGAALPATDDQAATYAASRKTEKKAKQPAPPKKPAIDYTGEFVNFGQWKEVQQFFDEMVEKHGYQRSELENLFLQVRYIDSA